ncbi:MAG TPA: 16S rRNA (cytosine(1402)-N(4))-methyltransferase RsmH [Acidimicrobiia bacterium]|nr:16S rRNA (cytosine(1402)-N(4))-methyltransferase RsmH [Acidimicrobiia bacterium]
MTQDREYHRPVMAGEVVELLGQVPAGVVVDATYGGGGHARELLRVLGPRHRVLGVDRDPEAVARAERPGGRLKVVHGNFADLEDVLVREGIEAPVGVLFDFGVSSHQLDEARRGFSYRQPGPLDMRMDPGQAVSAADIVNDTAASELASLIRRFGEEPRAARIADAIVKARPITDTVELAEIIASAVPGHRQRAHPARKTFQAIRIAVNDEIRAVEQGIDQALEALAIEGRCVAVSYHSLEDRAVKRRLAAAVAGCVCPPDLPVCGCGATARFRLLTRGALKASPAEVTDNPRARSARLRALTRVAA